MNQLGKLVLVGGVGLGALTGCAKPAPVVDVAADEAAVRAINPEWFKAYAAGDAAAIAALYADDAVVSAPGLASSRGRAAIQAMFVNDIAASAAAGISFKPGSSPEFGVSGDIGWEWNSFTLTDKSGATVDTGKYVTVYARRNGKWQIVRDIWNTDSAPPSAPAEAAESAAPAPGV